MDSVVVSKGTWRSCFFFCYRSSVSFKCAANKRPRLRNKLDISEQEGGKGGNQILSKVLIFCAASGKLGFVFLRYVNLICLSGDMVLGNPLTRAHLTYLQE